MTCSRVNTLVRKEASLRRSLTVCVERIGAGCGGVVECKATFSENNSL